jgi:hypothetical protein
MRKKQTVMNYLIMNPSPLTEGNAAFMGYASVNEIIFR